MSRQTRPKRDPKLHLAMRSRVASRRPVCPECGSRCPGPDEARDEWTLPWGHRRPQDRSPCPGFRTSPTIAPPPPLPPPKPAVRLARAAFDLAAWNAWFDAVRVAPTTRPAMAARAPRASKVPSANQLVLFTVDGLTWRELHETVPATDVRSRHAELRHVAADPARASDRMRA